MQLRTEAVFVAVAFDVGLALSGALLGAGAVLLALEVDAPPGFDFAGAGALRSLLDDAALLLATGALRAPAAAVLGAICAGCLMSWRAGERCGQVSPLRSAAGQCSQVAPQLHPVSCSGQLARKAGLKGSSGHGGFSTYMNRACTALQACWIGPVQRLSRLQAREHGLCHRCSIR